MTVAEVRSAAGCAFVRGAVCGATSVKGEGHVGGVPKRGRRGLFSFIVYHALWRRRCSSRRGNIFEYLPLIGCNRAYLSLLGFGSGRKFERYSVLAGLNGPQNGRGRGKRGVCCVGQILFFVRQTR